MAERTTRTASRRATPQAAPDAGRVAASQSPPKRTTRETRSRSYDISDSEDGRKGVRARRGAKQVNVKVVDSAAGQSTTRGRKGKTVNGSRALQDLTTVVEDPSTVYLNLGSGEEDDPERMNEAGETSAQPTAQPSKSPGGASAFSGTTARTSLSARDLSDSSSEEMLDALPDLADASSKILGFLIPMGISEASITSVARQLRTKDSRASKNLRRLGSTFQVQRDIYGSDSYINPRGILRVLLGTKQIQGKDRGQWRPDALLHKANVAVLASSILSHSMQERNDQLVEELEQAFPICFVESIVQSEIPTPGSSALIHETFQLALEIRTQYTILSFARYAGQRNFDFDDILHQIFFKNGNSLKGWAILGLRGEDLTGGFQEVVVQRLEELRDTFIATSETPTARVEVLKKNYSWANFVQQTIGWIRQRLVEIEMQIELHGGAQDIYQSLSNEIQRRILAELTIGSDGDADVSPPLVLTYEPPSEASLTTSDQHDTSHLSARTKKLKVQHYSKSSPMAMSAMGNLKGRLGRPKAANPTQLNSMQPAQQNASNVQVPSTAGPSTVALLVGLQDDEPALSPPTPARAPDEQQEYPPQQEDTWRAQEGDDDPFMNPGGNPDEQLYATQTFALKAKNDAESNKENVAEASQHPLQSPPEKLRFTDRQEGAHKVLFESQESTSPERAQLGSVKKGKRPLRDGLGADDEVSEVSSDGDFEHMRVTADTAQKRSSKRPATEATRSQGPSPKRARFQESNDSRSQAPVRIRDEDRPGPSRSQTLVRDMDEDRPTPSQMDEYRAANAAAKEKKAFQIKPTQTRRPWSEEETERLLELIVKHGVSWKLLKQEDEIARGGPLLRNRDQTALKDKARNMKMDYLKTTRRLPDKFYRIPLNKILKDRLKSEGITYDDETGQREDALVDDD